MTVNDHRHSPLKGRFLKSVELHYGISMYIFSYSIVVRQVFKLEEDDLFDPNEGD